MDKRTDIRMPNLDKTIKEYKLLSALEEVLHKFNENEQKYTRIYVEYQHKSEDAYQYMLNCLFWFQSQIALMNDHYNHIKIDLKFEDTLAVTIRWADQGRQYTRENAQ